MTKGGMWTGWDSGYTSTFYFQVTQNEVYILASLNHPNIIQYFDSFVLENKLHIVMEYALQGNLHDYIKRQDKLLTQKVKYKTYYLSATFDAWLSQKVSFSRSWDMTPEVIPDMAKMTDRRYRNINQ